MPKKLVSDEEYFLSRIKKTRSCWLWVGGKNSSGYGEIKSPKRKRITAHRFSFQYFNGAIKPGLFVCHKCDNPICVKPAHLFLGTPKDNWLDAFRKGRIPGFKDFDHRKSGNATRDKYGREFYVKIGKLGYAASKTKKKYAFGGDKGGGAACLKKYGRKHFMLLGKKSAAKRKLKKI